MNRQIFRFELNGETVLGFDTGLDVRSFAQAKMAWFLSDTGSIVYPGGETENWQPGGVVELKRHSKKTMVVWGPNIPGEEMAELIESPGRKDEGLDALRFWLMARMTLEKKGGGKKEAPFSGPAGAVIMQENQGTYPAGTVFFPPARLIKRTLETGGNEALLDAERYVHPDLYGPEDISFSAGAMLYRIFGSAPPFSPDEPANGDTLQAELRRNISEGVFVPPRLMSPGLDGEMSELITKSISRISRDKGTHSRPGPEHICSALGPPHSRPVSSWLKPLAPHEVSAIRAEHEEYSKRSALKVKTRRFVIRNTAIIAGVVIALLVLALSVRGYLKRQAELPTTRGMEAIEVANTYYLSFGSLDHTMMELCVTGNAGKQDIQMVMNLFVITRVRQAYEAGRETFISAQEWIDSGSPATEATVFGITGLSVNALSQDREHASLEADYILWMPVSEDGSRETTAGHKTTDRLNLVFIKGIWRIAEIERTSSQINF